MRLLLAVREVEEVLGAERVVVGEALSLEADGQLGDGLVAADHHDEAVDEPAPAREPPGAAGVRPDASDRGRKVEVEAGRVEPEGAAKRAVLEVAHAAPLRVALKGAAGSAVEAHGGLPREARGARGYVGGEAHALMGLRGWSMVRGDSPTVAPGRSSRRSAPYTGRPPRVCTRGLRATTCGSRRALSWSRFMRACLRTSRVRGP